MRLAALLLSSAVVFAQPDAVADKMLARMDGAAWGAAYVAAKTCRPRPPSQVFGANDQWSESCTSRANGFIEETFFYAFDESGPVRLRIEIRPEPPVSADVGRVLKERLTKRFGAPVHRVNMMEIGLPMPGDQWASDKLHYILFQNPIGFHEGVRGPVQLIVLGSRLFEEIQKDKFIQETDVLFYPPSPARPFLRKLLGDDYIRMLDAQPKTPAETRSAAQQTSRAAVELLETANRALLDERAMLLLAVNNLVAKLSTMLWDNPAEDAATSETGAIRQQLSKFGVKLGGNLHNGGLEYNQDLLWRVWREFPDSQAGQLAFLELQQRGWYTDSGIGCPANPDLFHDVIERGEAFLRQHPSTQFRKEVLFTLAVANESWWSVAHAPANDEWVEGIPYPRKALNKQQAAAARERAIRYYQELVKLAPDSPEAGSAERRLPRLNLALDTGQRRFFCSYD